MKRFWRYAAIGLRSLLHTEFVNPIANAIGKRLPIALSSYFYSAFGTELYDPRQPYFVKAFAHVATIGLKGDYLEFGVSEGHSLIMAHQAAKICQLKGMRLFGFDTFQGLPESEGIWVKGAYGSSKANTIRHLRRRKVNTKGLVLVEGLFDETLNETVKGLHNLQDAAIIHIDCDLYSATKAYLHLSKIWFNQEQ